jgi:hypothetical protein
MYTYILVIVFLAIAIAPQLLAVWYIKWENKKETIAEQFVKEMISAIDSGIVRMSSDRWKLFKPEKR